MFREKAQSALAGFADGSYILVELEFEEDNFCRGRKTREPEKKPSKQSENQQQTQPRYGTGSESNPGHTGVRRELSALRHPCCPSAI